MNKRNNIANNTKESKPLDTKNSKLKYSFNKKSTLNRGSKTENNVSRTRKKAIGIGIKTTRKRIYVTSERAIRSRKVLRAKSKKSRRRK